MEELTKTDKETAKTKDTHRIQDCGEKIAGVRKDLRYETERLKTVTEKALMENTLSRIFKEPDWRKAEETEEGWTKEDTCLAEALAENVTEEKKPGAGGWHQKIKMERWAKETAGKIEALRKYMELTKEEREWFREKLIKEDSDADTWLKMKVRERTGACYGGKSRTKGLVLRKGQVNGKTIYVIGRDHRKIAESDTAEKALDKLVRMIKVEKGEQADVTDCLTYLSTRLKRTETGRTTLGYWRKNKKGFGEYKQEEIEDERKEERKKQLQESGCYSISEGKVYEYGEKTDYKIYYTTLEGETKEISERKFETEEEARAYTERRREAAAEAVQRLFRESKPEEKKKGRKYDIKYAYLKKEGELTEKDLYPDGTVRKVPTLFVPGKQTVDGKDLILRQFDRERDGFDFLRDHAEELEAEADLFNKTAGEKEKTFFTPDNERKGEDRRHGTDITPEQLQARFRLRGIQFGNWASDKDRQRAINETYDALADLAELIGWDDSEIGLDGNLALAFGARGTGGFNAHYETLERVINLTKTRGAGNLAHEWLHALDNHLGKEPDNPSGMMTEQLGRRTSIYDCLRDEMAQITKKIRNSAYNSRTRCYSDGKYWNSSVEMWARLFAEWVCHRLAEQGKMNRFLTRGVDREHFINEADRMYAAYSKRMQIKGEEPMERKRWINSDDCLRIMRVPYPTRPEALEYTTLMESFLKKARERIYGKK